jgi:indolepyruvate ferredoxin oxidoreductase beta subunit
MNIHLIGVGGQGIGLLSEVLIRAADHAGFSVTGVDTHGLAQRGGIVVSQIKIGETIHSPLIMKGNADLVVALERHEALRGVKDYLKNSGTLIYYNVVWQPIDVRLNNSEEVSEALLEQECHKRKIMIIKAYKSDLPNARMQNMVLLANICKYQLIPGLEKEHFQMAMEDLMTGEMLKDNISLYNQESGTCRISD